MPISPPAPEGVSLVLRTLGRWPLLDRALHGVLSQHGVVPSELIVCSPEPVVPMVRAWLQGYASRLAMPVRVVADSLEKPLEPMIAAIEATPAGQWVAFLDDDDHWPEYHLAEMLAHAEPGRCLLAPGCLVTEHLGYDWQIKEDTQVPQRRMEARSMAEIWNDLDPSMSCWIFPRGMLVEMLRSIPAPSHADLARQISTLAMLRGNMARAAVREVLVSLRPASVGDDPYANRCRGNPRGACERILQGIYRSPAGNSLDSGAIAAMRGLASAVCASPLPVPEDTRPSPPKKHLPPVDATSSPGKASGPDGGSSGGWLRDFRKSKDKGKPHAEKKAFAPGFKRVGLVSPAGLQPSDVTDALKGKKRLSVDVFDTTLARRVARPADLFLRIGEQAGAMPGVENARHFWALRIAAEREARCRCKATRGHDEPTLQDIYAVLADWCGWDAEETRRVESIELACEDAFLYAVPALEKIMADARRAGCEVVFLSDMYHSSETIGGWLKSRELDFDGLHVSCEEGANKASGAMFLKLAGTRQWKPEEQAHVGDNSVADVSAPASQGIAALRFRDLTGNRALIDQVAVPAHDDHDFGFSLAVGLAREYRRREEPGGFPSRHHWMMSQLGYEVGGVLALGFSHWVLRRAKALGLGRLNFLGRDGWLFQQVTEKTAEAWRVPVEAGYIHGSRRLFELACLADWAEPDMKTVCFPVPGMTFADWLGRLQITWEEAGGEARKAGFAEPGQVLADPFFRAIDPKTHTRLLALMQRLRKPIQARARAARDLLDRYAREHGIRAADSAIVDLGWAGSSARNFQRVVRRSEGPGARLRAFYFGSWDLARKALNDGCLLESWHFSIKPFKPSGSLAPPPQRHQIAMESIPLLEMLFSCTEPSVIGMAETKDRGIAPVFAEPEFGETEISLLAEFHRGALRFAADFLRQIPDMPGSLALDVYAEHVLKRFLSLPSPEEGQLFSRFIPREEHIAGTPVRTLCSVPAPDPEIDRRSQLLAAYEACMWKKGFRTQLDAADHKLLPDAL